MPLTYLMKCHCITSFSVNFESSLELKDRLFNMNALNFSFVLIRLTEILGLLPLAVLPRAGVNYKMTAQSRYEYDFSTQSAF
jgi:hypothetical protein